MQLQKLIIFISFILILNSFLKFCIISAIETKQQEKTGRIFDFDYLSYLFEDSDEEYAKKEVVICKYPKCSISIMETNNTSTNTTSGMCTFKNIQTQWLTINNLKYRIKSDWTDLLRHVDDVNNTNANLKRIQAQIKTWKGKIKETDDKIKKITDNIKAGNDLIKKYKANLKKEKDTKKMTAIKQRINVESLLTSRNMTAKSNLEKYVQRLRTRKASAKKVDTMQAGRIKAITKQNVESITQIISHWKDLETNWMEIKAKCMKIEHKWTVIVTNWNKFEKLLNSLKTFNPEEPIRISSDVWHDFDSSVDGLIWALSIN